MFCLKKQLTTVSTMPCIRKCTSRVFPADLVVKNLLPLQETQVRSLLREDPMHHGAAKPCTPTTAPVCALSLGSAARQAPATRRLHAATREQSPLPPTTAPVCALSLGSATRQAPATRSLHAATREQSLLPTTREEPPLTTTRERSPLTTICKKPEQQRRPTTAKNKHLF